MCDVAHQEAGGRARASVDERWGYHRRWSVGLQRSCWIALDPPKCPEHLDMKSRIRVSGVLEGRGHLVRLG